MGVLEEANASHDARPAGFFSSSLFVAFTERPLCISAGQKERTAQRLPIKPPAAEHVRHVRHGVRLAPPAREAHPGLLRVRGNRKSLFCFLLSFAWKQTCTFFFMLNLEHNILPLFPKMDFGAFLNLNLLLPSCSVADMWSALIPS